VLLHILTHQMSKEIEDRLVEYDAWLELFNTACRRRGWTGVRREKDLGCVDLRTLREAYAQPLSREMRREADWLWVIDAACRSLLSYEKQKPETPRFSTLLRLYYGLGEGCRQAETDGGLRRRRLVMKAEHIEQSSFYDLRKQLLAAVYTAGVQRGLFKPYPEESAQEPELSA